MRNYLRNRKEVLYLGLIVMTATLIPYLIGYSVQGEDWRFTGFVIGVEDGNSYIAKMLSGAAGGWLFRSPYSIESQTGVVAFLPYLLLGKLTSSPAQHEQLVTLYHAFRFVAGILAIFASYDFISVFIKNELHRLWALCLVVLGGGAGWVLVSLQGKNFLGSVPLDFISPESFGFLGLLGFPHLAASRALLLWGMVNYLDKKKGIVAGLLWLLMGLMQPLAMLVAWSVVVAHVIIEWVIIDFRSGSFEITWSGDGKDELKTATRAILVSSPIFLYTAYMFVTDPYLQVWSRQNILPSPSWVHYLIAYGLVLPFTIGGIIKLWNQDPRRGLFLAVWLGILPILVSLPVGTQRRLAEGIWVVMITGFVAFFSDFSTRPILLKIVSILILPTSFLLFVGAILQAANPSRPVFIPAREASAYMALKNIAPDNSKVLATFQTGNNLPAWAPVRVVIGHGPETVNLGQWQDRADRLLGSEDADRACSELLSKFGIDYLFWGPKELEQWKLDPGQQDCLIAVYDEEEYKIYKVIR